MISETHHDVCVKRKNLQNADQFCFLIGRDSEWTKFPCFDYHLLCTASPPAKIVQDVLDVHCNICIITQYACIFCFKAQ